MKLRLLEHRFTERHTRLLGAHLAAYRTNAWTVYALRLGSRMWTWRTRPGGPAGTWSW